MTARYDIIIRGGLVVDGTGAEPRPADVAISRGMIQAVGIVDGAGAEEIDAAGLIVTPGFIDLHTHYDGQAIWSQRLNPSSSHGVTTVIMGNCGVGFAPCRPQDRELLCATMEGVEDIPGVVMREGLTWDWETFPEYLDVLAAGRRDIDIGVFAPHSPVRVNVMGQRGADREEPTATDLIAMGALIREAVAAGALGFATSRTAVDRRSDGEHIPSFDTGEPELVAAAQAVKDAGGGLIQMIPELGMTGLTPTQEFALMRGVSDAVGLPITYTVVPSRNKNRHFWHELLELTQAHNRSGGALIHPQYFPRPVGMMASFELSSNPFVNTPAYKALAHLPLAERVIELRKPDVRARILADDPDEALLPLTAMTRQYDVMFELSDPPCYEPGPGSSIADRAAREGRDPAAVAYDLLLENNGKGMLFVAFGNYPGDTLDHVFDFFDDPHSVMGLGDGMGGEDYQLGVRLELAGVPMFFSRRMLTVESEEHHRGEGQQLLRRDHELPEAEYLARLADWGVTARSTDGKYDGSHMVLDLVYGLRATASLGNHYQLSDLGPEDLEDTASTLPTVYWFDGRPLEEL